MLINLRNALMTGKRLPYDAEVEFLQSDGGQYIITGLTVKSSLRILLDVQVDDICRIFGGRTESGSNQFDLFQYSTTAIRPSYGNRSVNVTGVGTGRHTFDFDQNVFSVDGVVKQTFSAQTFSAPSSVYIGALSTNNSGLVSSSKLIGRIYSYKIWDNGVLAQNCIPVRKGTVGYLYDRVTGKLFGNAGTGDFVVGRDVVPMTWQDGLQYNNVGTPVESATSSIGLDYIPITAGHSFTWRLGYGSSASADLIIYNANKERIDYWVARDRTVTISGAAAYMRISALTSYKEQATVYDETAQKYVFANGRIPAE